MKKALASFFAVALLAAASSSGSVSASTTGAEQHPFIRTAINNLQAARVDLQNAAHDYCGHRAAALEAVNVAINQLGRALDCAAAKGQAAGEAEMVAESYESTGPVAAGERHPNIRKAANALQRAKADLEDASHVFCGHRAEALEACNAALNQLNQALQCDKD